MSGSSGPYLQSLAQARSVEWGQVWRWDCYFPDAPAPFDQWFPATGVNRNMSQLETHSFTGFGDTFEIPYASGMRSFTVTFADDHTATLLTWLESWMELGSLGRGQWTNRLSSIVKQCYLAQLDGSGNEQHTWSMQVFPFGELSFLGESQSSHVSYQLSFRIAGLDNPGA